MHANNEVGTIQPIAEIGNIAATTGSACHEDSIEISPVLDAMGISEDRAKGAIRFSLGRHTTKEEINKTIEILKKVIRNY